MKSHSLVIPSRFCGPPTSGNGGYSCAFVARAIGGCAGVTLRKPIPIEGEMHIVSPGLQIPALVNTITIES